MAIYHLNVKTVGRSAGRSATAAAAYRSGEKIPCVRTGQVHDYTRRRGVEHTEIVLPENAPEWATDRVMLWNVAEQSEKRKNSTVAREFEAALPAELNKTQRLELVRELAGDLVQRHGMAVDIAIHTPGKKGDHQNHHAHLLCSTRRITPDGFGDKTRELDEKKRGEVKHWREQWEKISNRHLENAGHQARIDHRSLEDQGIDRIPQIHLGVNVIEMERRGIKTGRKALWRDINKCNAETIYLQAARETIEKQIKEEQEELERQARARAEREKAVQVARERVEREQVEQAEREQICVDVTKSIAVPWGANERQAARIRGILENDLPHSRGDLNWATGAHRAHDAQRSKEPIGRLAVFKQKKYKQELAAWEKEKWQIEKSIVSAIGDSTENLKAEVNKLEKELRRLLDDVVEARVAQKNAEPERTEREKAERERIEQEAREREKAEQERQEQAEHEKAAQARLEEIERERQEELDQALKEQVRLAAAEKEREKRFLEIKNSPMPDRRSRVIKDNPITAYRKEWKGFLKHNTDNVSVEGGDYRISTQLLIMGMEPADLEQAIKEGSPEQAISEAHGKADYAHRTVALAKNDPDVLQHQQRERERKAFESTPEGIKQTWKAEDARHKSALSSKISRMQVKARDELDRQRQKMREHRLSRPIPPKKLFLPWRRKRYEQDLIYWETMRRGLNVRDEQLYWRLKTVTKASDTIYSRSAAMIAKEKPELDAAYREIMIQERIVAAREREERIAREQRGRRSEEGGT